MSLPCAGDCRQIGPESLHENEPRPRREVTYPLANESADRSALEPANILAVELLLDADVRHGRRSRCPVPVLFVRWNPNNVAGMDLLGLREASSYHGKWPIYAQLHVTRDDRAR